MCDLHEYLSVVSSIEKERANEFISFVSGHNLL